MLIKVKYCVSFLSLMTFLLFQFVIGEYYVHEYMLKCTSKQGTKLTELFQEQLHNI
jgi:hypothetical protein